MSCDRTSELRELAEDINWTEIVDHIDLTSRPLTVDGEWLDAWHAAFDAACERLDKEDDGTMLRCKWCGAEVRRLLRVSLIDVSTGHHVRTWVCERCRESI